MDINNPTINPVDSLHQVAKNAIIQLQSNPTVFWTEMVQQALHFGLKVLAALLIYLVGAWLIRYVKKLQHKLFLKRKTERTLASFISSLTSISLTVILIIITVGTLGVDTTSLAALLAAGGMAIGMALSGTVQNFAGGIMLLVFKPFKAGDFIEALGVKGTVVDVSIISTKILTTDNRVVVLPNGSLSNSNIDNYSAQPLRRVEWNVSLAYGTDATAAKNTILAMFAADERILNHTTPRPKDTRMVGVTAAEEVIPDPFVGILSLNSSDITFVVRVWVPAEVYWDVFFQYNERFYTELPEAGFHFAYPHLDVHVAQQ